MAHIERKTTFHVVSSSRARHDAFASLLGPENVRQVRPHFTEDIIRKPINTQTAEWPMEMSETKAFQDIAALMVLSYLNQTVETGLRGDVRMDNERIIRLYSDTINIAYAGDTLDDATLILEKPRNIENWIVDRERGAMALSGKHTELCTAITAIDMTNPDVHPRTVLVRTAIKMRPYTEKDVRAFVDRHGKEAIMKSASGISFINGSVELFDTEQPLRMYIQTDPNLPPSLIAELPTWSHLTQEDRQRILYGAVPEAIQLLTSEFPEAKPQLRGRTTAQRYGTKPNTPPNLQLP